MVLLGAFCFAAGRLTAGRGVRGLVMFSLGLVHLNKYRTSYERLRQPVLPDLQILAFMLSHPCGDKTTPRMGNPASALSAMGTVPESCLRFHPRRTHAAYNEAWRLSGNPFRQRYLARSRLLRERRRLRCARSTSRPLTGVWRHCSSRSTPTGPAMTSL